MTWIWLVSAGWFLLGLVIGVSLGALVMGWLVAGSEADERLATDPGDIGDAEFARDDERVHVR